MVRHLILLAPFITPSVSTAQGPSPAWHILAAGQYTRAFGSGGGGFVLSVARSFSPHIRAGIPFSVSWTGLDSGSGHRQLLMVGGELTFLTTRGPHSLVAFVGTGAYLVSSNVPLYSYPISAGPSGLTHTHDDSGIGLSIRPGVGLPIGGSVLLSLSTTVVYQRLYHGDQSVIWAIGIGIGSR
jgi:hypothetical protein